MNVVHVGNGKGFSIDLRSIVTLLTIFGALVASYIQVNLRVGALEIKVDTLKNTYSKVEIDALRNANDLRVQEMFTRMDKMEDKLDRNYQASRDNYRQIRKQTNYENPPIYGR